MPSGCTIAEAIVLSRRKAPSSIGWGQPGSRRSRPTADTCTICVSRLDLYGSCGAPTSNRAGMNRCYQASRWLVTIFHRMAEMSSSRLNPAGQPSQVWLAPLDRSAPPFQIASAGEDSPRFGPSGQLLFRFTDNKFNYVGRMNKDGSGRSKVVPYPISTFLNISPDRRWLIAITPLFDAGQTSAFMAVPTGGGSPRPICVNGRACPSAWSPDGRFLYVPLERQSQTSAGKMIALPVVPETGLPDLPEAGIQSEEDATAIPGSFVVEQSNIVPGLDPATYAYVKTTAHRNLFQIHLP